MGRRGHKVLRAAFRVALLPLCDNCGDKRNELDARTRSNGHLPYRLAG